MEASIHTLTLTLTPTRDTVMHGWMADVWGSALKEPLLLCAALSDSDYKSCSIVYASR